MDRVLATIRRNTRIPSAGLIQSSLNTANDSLFVAASMRNLYVESWGSMVLMVFY